MGSGGRFRGGDGGGRDGGDGSGGDGGGGSGWADAVRDIWGRPPWLDKKKDKPTQPERSEREAGKVAVAEKPRETTQESDIRKPEQQQEKSEKPSMLEQIVSPFVKLARKLGMNIPDRENKMIYTPEGIKPEIPRVQFCQRAE